MRTGRFARVWPANERFFHHLRSRGALIGVAVDPLTSHECGNQRYLAIPWLDACLEARLPDAPGQALREFPADDTQLAPLPGPKAVPATKLGGDPRTASWLPNQRIARLWEHYVRDPHFPDATPPPAPTALEVDGAQLRWQAEADPESGLAHFLIERDGTIIARVPDNARNRFGRPLFQGLQYSDTPVVPLAGMRFTDPAPVPGRIHRYRVIAVNTVGRKSR